MNRSRCMTLTLVCLPLLWGCGAPPQAGQPTPAELSELPPRPAGATIGSLNELTQLRGNNVDLLRVLALLARDHNPAVDMAELEARLTARAVQVRRLLQGRSNAEAIRQALNQVVLSGLSPRRGDVDANEPRDLDAAQVLQSGTGTCISLTMLYVAVAQRAGLPVHAVYARKHIFPRVEADDRRLDIEAVDGGRVAPKGFHRKRFDLHPQAIADGQVMRSLNDREFVGQLLCAYGTALALEKDERAGRMLELSVRVAPHVGLMWHNYATWLHASGRLEEARHCADRALARDPYLVDAWLSSAQLNRRQRKLAEAMDDVNAALKLAPGDTRALLIRAELHGLLGDMPGAAADAHTVLEQNPHSADAHMILARLYALSTQPELALPHLRQAVQYGAFTRADLTDLKDFAALHEDREFQALVQSLPQ